LEHVEKVVSLVGRCNKKWHEETENKELD
jgi:hypothetical protein